MLTLFRLVVRTTLRITEMSKEEKREGEYNKIDTL